MFNWFKKSKLKCLHLKEFGKKPLSNMVKIFEFCDTKGTGTLGYSIYQCASCGKRSFGCMHLHLMGEAQCKAIDEFINYKMSRDDFVAFLVKEMAWYREVTALEAMIKGE